MKFYGQNQTNGGYGIDPIDKVLYDRYFTGKTDGFFIEAGANDGLFLTSCKVFEDIGWSGFNIEPSRKLFALLKENRPNSININQALFDHETQVEFEDIDYDNGGWSRVADPNGRHSNCHLQVASKYIVKANTYDNILKEYDIKEVDLFVLDVEGFEIEVIRGMGSDLSRKPKIFCIEHTHVGLDILITELQQEYYQDWCDGLNVIFKRRDI